MSVGRLGRERIYLYVPQAEVDEALSMGAVWVAGDSRLVQPRPLPLGVSEAAFARWRTAQARYRWCLEQMRTILADLEVPKAKRAAADTVHAEQLAARESRRVYLYVPVQEVDKVRGRPGVRWDRRHRMYYAEPEADLSALFRWLTPRAQAAWAAEREATRMLDHLVREEARNEHARRGSAGSGGIQSGRDAAAIQPSDDA